MTATTMEGAGAAASAPSGPFGLPFREVWLVDFEFRAPGAERPEVVCMVAKEVGSGRLLRLWADELGDTPPFDTGPDTLFVAYFASAEFSCFLQLGWPLPARVLDLYTEFRCITNGQTLPLGRGLLGAMAHFALPSLSKDEKQDMRALVMRGGPYTAEEAEGILDYCQSDVDALGPLLERMVPHIDRGDAGLGQALLRGRYMRAVAHMERTGVPIDGPTLALIQSRWDDIKLALIEAVDADFGVYDGASFRSSRFQNYLDREGIPWPRLDTGALALDSDTFRDMAKAYPQINPLKELRSSLGELRLNSIGVGSDGRNRTLLSPFASRTGRNQPSNSKFIFGPSVWIRNLIVAPEGRALAYIDWSSQEVAIAAALSHDAALTEAVRSGDPYLSFAKMSGLVPDHATKESHPDERDMCKVAVLGTNYGMQRDLLSLRTGVTKIVADEILRRLRRTFPVYFHWADENINRALLHGHMDTVFGWRLHPPMHAKPNSLRNFPMQANGAEMMRLAACLLTEAGIAVSAPVHDAFLIEGPADRIEEVVAEAQALMAEASRVVLGGWVIPTDAKIIGPGERYADKRGDAMWDRVMGLVGV